MAEEGIPVITHFKVVLKLPLSKIIVGLKLYQEKLLINEYSGSVLITKVSPIQTGFGVCISGTVMFTGEFEGIVNILLTVPQLPPLTSFLLIKPNVVSIWYT